MKFSNITHHNFLFKVGYFNISLPNRFKKPPLISDERYQKELKLATNAGALIITDNQKDRNKSYNTGERALADYLISKNYHELGDSGQWIKHEIVNNHSIPIYINNKSFTLQDGLDTLLTASKSEHETKLLTKYASINPNITIQVVSDISTLDKSIQQDVINGAMYYPKGNTLIVNLSSTEWESSFIELLNHELTHSVTFDVIGFDDIPSKLTDKQRQVFNQVADLLNDYRMMYGHELDPYYLYRLDYGLTKDFPNELVAVFTAESMVRNKIKQDLPQVFNQLNDLVGQIIKEHGNEQYVQRTGTGIGEKRSNDVLSSIDGTTTESTQGLSTTGRESNQSQGIGFNHETNLPTLQTEQNQVNGKSSKVVVAKTDYLLDKVNKADSKYVFVFGDNLERKGTGGQAVIRGSNKAIGLATKKLPSTIENAYFTDSEFEANKQHIDNDIQAIKQKASGKVLVFPKDGIGTGLAKLKDKAPKTWEYLNQRLLAEFGFDNVNGEVLSQVSYGQRDGLVNLPDIPVVTIYAKDIGFDDTKKLADEILRQLQGKDNLVNDDTGWTLTVGKKDRQKMGDNKNLSHATSQSIQGIVELVKHAVVAETHQDIKHSNPDVKAVHRLYVPALIDGQLYRVKLTVKDYQFTTGQDSKKALHAIEAVEIENALLGTLPSYSTSKDVQTVQPTIGHKLSVVDLLQGVNRDGDGLAFDVGLSQGNNINTGSIEFVTHHEDGYRGRTAINAKEADVTIHIAKDFNTAGERLTKKEVVNAGKLYIPIQYSENKQIDDSLVNRIVDKLNTIDGRRLNIAGNGIYSLDTTQDSVDEWTYTLLSRVNSHPNLKTKIQSIRSGGQTGFDEAGVKAGARLGIKSVVLTPKDYRFRVKTNDGKYKDISDEVAFKARFVNNIGLSQASNNASNLVAPIHEQARVLQGEAVIDIDETKSDIPKQGGFNQMVKWAMGLFERWDNKANNPVLGEITLNEQSARDSLAHGKFNPYKNLAFMGIKAVLEKGVLVAQDSNGHEDSFYISAPININGIRNIQTVLVHRDVNTQRMYIHSVILENGLLKPRVSEAQDIKSRKHNSSLTSADVHNILHKALTYKGNTDVGLSQQQNDEPIVYPEVDLNDGQQKAVDEIMAFINDPNRTTHALVGSAGSGKTTTLKSILNRIRKLDSKFNIIMTSPTHRANSITRTNMPKEFVATLDSLLQTTKVGNGFASLDDIRPDEPKKYPNNRIVIVDEASMMSEYQYNKLKDIHGKGKNNKLLFVGDLAQLKPVKSDKLSEALTSTQVILTKPKNNTPNPLQSSQTLANDFSATS